MQVTILKQTSAAIKAAVDSGAEVYAGNTSYQVIRDSLGQYLIKCLFNNHCIGLHGRDESDLNGSDFFTVQS